MNGAKRATTDMLTTFSLAAGLSVDSMAAAMATGCVLRRPRWRDAAMVGTTFGICQMAITLVGILVGVALMSTVGDWDHWVAFGLLVLVGAQMIRHSVRGGDGDSDSARPTWIALLAMGVGTSIDAGVVGIGLGISAFNISLTVAAIGAVTFAFSFAGVMCGRCVGRRAGACAQILGGLVLVAIGARILAVHLSA